MNQTELSIPNSRVEIIDNFKGDYAFLSNFYPCEVTYDFEPFPSAEHAYQTQKVTSAERRQQIATAETPGEAKRLGKKLRQRCNWSEHKVQIMTHIVYLKFLQNRDLRKKLEDTGDAFLMEGNDWGDIFWGVTDASGGKNVLGTILMTVRTAFQYGMAI